MKRFIFVVAIGLAAPAFAPGGASARQAQDQPQKPEDPRVDALEKKAALDRLNITGDIRVANDILNGTQAEHYDGLALQKGVIDSMFFMQTNGGAFPMPTSSAPESIYRVLENNVAAHYADYLYFTSRLTFADLKGAMAQFPPAQQQALMGMLMPATHRAEQSYDNNLMPSTRLRLNLRSEIAEHLSFSGRLAMYKIWGDSTGVQVFNGQPNSINVDGTTASVPNSDIVRVDRAYFDWNRIGGSGLYVSIGRRPSTGGPPLEIKEGKLRGGTPLGHVVDYQFDGVTVGYTFGESMPGAIWRFCYGVGYESGFGSGDQLRAPADRLSDVQFGGVNMDLYSSDTMFVQVTALRAANVTDGFNSLVVMPVDPLTGNPAPGPAVMRFTPSANLGDIDLAAALIERHDGPVHTFVSVAGEWTHPENVTTPFGGLLSDPFSAPVSHDAWSLYTGLRYDVAKSQVGVEYNYGSQYLVQLHARGRRDSALEARDARQRLRGVREPAGRRACLAARVGHQLRLPVQRQRVAHGRAEEDRRHAVAGVPDLQEHVQSARRLQRQVLGGLSVAVGRGFQPRHRMVVVST